MCLQVPLKILSVDEGFVVTEGDRKLIFKGNISIKPGDYVLPYGNVIVSVVGKQAALSMRNVLLKHSV